MAALVVQSRFAGLKIEDDDGPSSNESTKAKKNKTGAAKKPAEPAKKKNNTAKPQQPNAPKKKKQKQPPPPVEQWEQWKQKDEELVDGNYETELQQAMLLSKLDYEEKKDVYKQLKKEAELEKKSSEPAIKNNKKQKKKNVMSLDQFNDMVSGEDAKSNHLEEDKQATEEQKSTDNDKDTAFFERVKDEAKNEIIKEKIIDKIRNRMAAPDEIITRVQFADALEKKDKEIAELKLEIIGLKEELLTVKSRNRKLCNILGQGEMKDKAEVLVEVEKLRNVQSELTAEISSLHSELEKERSNKNTDPRAKDKKKKSGEKEK